MRQLRMMVPSLLFCAVSLTACGETKLIRETIEIEAPKPDRLLMIPTPFPEVTAPDPTQRDASLVIEDFKEALNSCNADKAAIEKSLWPVDLK